MTDENAKKGLTADDIDQINEIIQLIENCRESIVNDLPPHRHTSIAVTHLDTAKLWLADRLEVTQVEERRAQRRAWLAKAREGQ